jgi:hypothetical protein
MQANDKPNVTWLLLKSTNRGRKAKKKAAILGLRTVDTTPCQQLMGIRNRG